MLEEYNKSNHRVYSMKAHIVLVCKYRYSILTPQFEEAIKRYITDLGVKKDFKVIEMKGDLNHIHILVDYSIFYSGEEMIKAIKGFSTIQAFKEWGEYLEGIYREKRVLWSGGAFICSTGQGSEEIVAKYIREQGLKK